MKDVIVIYKNMKSDKELDVKVFVLFFVQYFLFCVFIFNFYNKVSIYMFWKTGCRGIIFLALVRPRDEKFQFWPNEAMGTFQELDTFLEKVNLIFIILKVQTSSSTFGIPDPREPKFWKLSIPDPSSSTLWVSITRFIGSCHYDS